MYYYRVYNFYSSFRFFVCLEDIKMSERKDKAEKEKQCEAELRDREAGEKRSEKEEQERNLHPEFLGKNDQPPNLASIQLPPTVIKDKAEKEKQREAELQDREAREKRSEKEEQESINDEKQKFKMARIEKEILDLYEEFDMEKSENPKTDLSQKRSQRIKQLVENMQEHENQMLRKVEGELIKTKNDLEELKKKFSLRMFRKKKNQVCIPGSNKQTNKGEKRSSWIKRIKCPECDKKFYKSQTMNIHVKKVHEGMDRPHKCPGYMGISCSKDFTTSDGLKDHHKIIHLGLRFNCPFCSKDCFKRRSALKSHVKVQHPLEYERIIQEAEIAKEAETAKEAQNANESPVEMKDKAEKKKQCEAELPDREAGKKRSEKEEQEKNLHPELLGKNDQPPNPASIPLTPSVIKDKAEKEKQREAELQDREAREKRSEKEEQERNLQNAKEQEKEDITMSMTRAYLNKTS